MLSLGRRELEVAQWTYALALGGVPDVAIKIMEEISEEIDRTPRWNVLKRWRLLAEWDFAWRMSSVFTAYAKTQEPVVEPSTRT